MNAKINHQEVPALPDTEESTVILDFIADMCANKEILKKFVNFIGSIVSVTDEFDFYSCIQNGQQVSTGLAVSGYGIKFVYTDNSEEARFFPVQQGKIYEMCSVQYGQATNFH